MPGSTSAKIRNVIVPVSTPTVVWQRQFDGTIALQELARSEWNSIPTRFLNRIVETNPLIAT